MKVLYDYQAFAMQSHGGVSRCFAELYKNLPDNIDAEIAINETDNTYLREMRIGRPRGYDLEHFIAPFHFPMKGRLFSAYNHVSYGLPYQSDNHLYFLSNEYQKIQSIKALKKGKFDVFHPTFFDDYFLPYLNGRPFVLTIHDMIPFIYRSLNINDWEWQISKITKLVSKASAIIAVSEQTKNDIVSILHIPEEKVHVIYHGSEHLSVPSPDVVNNSKFQDFSPYLLYVGERGYYKNFNLFVKEVAKVLKEHQEIKVICTGKPFNEDELRMMYSFGVKERFVHYWVSTNEELYLLYHNAVCFVYPSEYEGFGIPILEAYKANCPVMLNNASCFPEVAGDAAIYFNLKPSESNFQQQFEILYAISDKEREMLLIKQQNQLSRFSWKKAAVQLADVYHSVLP